jgi:hypothetical protein
MSEWNEAPPRNAGTLPLEAPPRSAGAVPPNPQSRAHARPAVAAAQRPLERLQGFFEKLSSGGFFGKVVVSFQNGKVCDVRIEQTKKLDEL